MAYYQYTAYPSNSTAALFRAWGSGAGAALQAVGVEKTTDTGQIDWMTVAAPVAANTVMGYEIRKITDSVGNPVFVKIEYGSGPSTTYPGIWITFGHGSDGNGNLTGNLSYRWPVMAANASTTDLCTCFASSDGTSWFTLGMFLRPGTSGYTFGLGAGRTRTDTGLVTNTALNICIAQPQTSTIINNSSSRGQMYLPKIGGGLVLRQAWWHTALPGTGRASNANGKGLFPVYCSNAGVPEPTDATCVAAWLDDVGGSAGAAGTPATLPIYGQNITYTCLGYIGDRSTTAHQVNGNAAENVTLFLRTE